MDRMKLEAQLRADRGKNAMYRLRQSGLVPAVVYGKAKEPVAVSVNPKAVVAVLNSHGGRNTPLDLTVEGEDGSRLALIKDYQVHPWKRILEHVDFWEVTADRVVTVAVPFKKTGISAAEKGGSVARIIRKVLKVRAVPDAIPAEISHDITKLPERQATVMVSEVALPEGVTAVYDRDYAVIALKVPKVVVVAEEEGEAAEVEETTEVVAE